MTDIVMKSERRWLLRGASPDQAFAVIGEVHTEDPNHPTVFVFQVNANPVTRAQLVDLGNLISKALTEAPESRIVVPPPGTRVPGVR